MSSSQVWKKWKKQKPRHGTTAVFSTSMEIFSLLPLLLSEMIIMHIHGAEGFVSLYHCISFLSDILPIINHGLINTFGNVIMPVFSSFITQTLKGENSRQNSAARFITRFLNFWKAWLLHWCSDTVACQKRRKNKGLNKSWGLLTEEGWLKNITIRIFFLFMHVRFVTLCFSGFSSKFCIAAIQSIGRKTRWSDLCSSLESIMTLEVMTSISGIFCCFWDWVSKNLLHVSRWLHENTSRTAALAG